MFTFACFLCFMFLLFRLFWLYLDILHFVCQQSSGPVIKEPVITCDRSDVVYITLYHCFYALSLLTFKDISDDFVLLLPNKLSLVISLFSFFFNHSSTHVTVYHRIVLTFFCLFASNFVVYFFCMKAFYHGVILHGLT